MSSNITAVNTGKSSWGGLEVSQKALTFIPYRGFHISIYASESMDGEPIKYFGSPIVLLNPNSAKYYYNQILNPPRHQVSFDVDMWNQDVEDFVIEHLNKLSNRPKTDSKYVQGIPFEEVILCSNVPSPMYELFSEWTPYQLDTKVNFTLYCPSEEKGRELAELLKNDRDFQIEFAKCFRIKLCVTTRESRQRNVKISIDNITSGKLISKLDQRFPNAEQVFLTAEDTKTILSESVNNVLVESFTDMKEVADPAAKDRIYSKLQTMLGMAQERIDSDSSKTWDSVFWNDENTRPDKVAKTLNETLNKLEKETKDKMKESFSNSSSSNKNASIDIDAKTRFLKMVNIKGKGDNSSSNSISTSNDKDKENCNRETKEIADKVEWNGEKFVPKPMYLTRMNLSTIRNKQTFQDKEIAVSYSTAFLDLKMNVPTEHGDVSFDNNHSTIDSFASIQKMKSELDELKRLAQETSTELSKLKAGVSEFNPKLDLAVTQIRQLGEQVKGYHSSSTFTGTFLWRITDYRSKKANANVTSIYSDSFYTSQNGYKLRLNAYLNGYGDGQGTHLSIFMEIQPGEYDALLPWPFSRKFTFALLDQSTNITEKNNVEWSMSASDCSKFPHCFTRPLNNKANLGYGTHKLASHDQLVFGEKYVKDDTLFIQIAAISEKMTSDYQSTCPFIWRITDYRSKKADTSQISIYSDAFYTSQNGYKLKMDARLNGVGEGAGTHLSIYMDIQPGEYDALLSWPFSRKFTIALLDQSTNTTEKNNVELSVDASSVSNQSFKRPLNNKANLGYGSPKFASHELLVEGGKYVKDDTLFIKITTSD